MTVFYIGPRVRNLVHSREAGFSNMIEFGANQTVFHVRFFSRDYRFQVACINAVDTVVSIL
jgi:hypothetical protein